MKYLPSPPPNLYFQWKRCPDCGDLKKKMYTAYFRCSCGYIDKKDVAYQVNSLEKEQRKVAKKMVEYLLPSATPQVKFPTSARGRGYTKTGRKKYKKNICAGWYDFPPIHAINIPRKSFFLSRHQFADTVAHESTHPATYEDEMEIINLVLKGEYGGDPGHSELFFRPKYLNEFRPRLFSRFRSWITNPTRNNLPTKFSKGYNIYPLLSKPYGNYWEAEYSIKNDTKFNPYEDD